MVVDEEEACRRLDWNVVVAVADIVPRGSFFLVLPPALKKKSDGGEDENPARGAEKSAAAGVLLLLLLLPKKSKDLLRAAFLAVLLLLLKASSRSRGIFCDYCTVRMWRSQCGFFSTLSLSRTTSTYKSIRCTHSSRLSSLFLCLLLGGKDRNGKRWATEKIRSHDLRSGFLS